MLGTKHTPWKIININVSHEDQITFKMKKIPFRVNWESEMVYTDVSQNKGGRSFRFAAVLKDKTFRGTHLRKTLIYIKQK